MNKQDVYTKKKRALQDRCEMSLDNEEKTGKIAKPIVVHYKKSGFTAIFHY
jgi:hypothetical protein